MSLKYVPPNAPYFSVISAGVSFELNSIYDEPSSSSFELFKKLKALS